MEDLMNSRAGELELAGKFGYTYPTGVAVADQLVAFSIQMVIKVTRHSYRRMAIEYG
jgi:hypothetical protein